MTLGNLIAALQLNNEHLIRRFFDENYDWISMKAHVLDEALHISPLEQQQWDLAYGHISDNDKHVSSQNRTEWDEAHSHVSNNDIHVTPQDKEKWNNANTHSGDTGSHTSADDRNSWDAAYQHTLNNDIHVTADDKDSWNAAEQNAKDYAKALFDAVKTLKIHICTDGVLPTENINTVCIYFVPLTDGEGNNLYEEYMYVDNNWERIGQTSVDLSQYVKKTEILNYVQQHANKAVLDKLSQDSEGNLIYDGKKIATDIDISAQQGNALFMAPDGLYVPTVPDLSDDFNTLQGDVKENHKNINKISQYHKFKNSNLKFCNYTCTTSNYRGLSEITDGKWSVVPLEIASYRYCDTENGIWEIDNDNGIIIPPNEKILINVTFSVANANADTHTPKFRIATTYNKISDTELNKVIDQQQCPLSKNAQKNVSLCGIYTNKTSENIKLYFVSNGNNLIRIYNLCITITEIGREIVIDPVEHVNDQQGIEDTPVGHILAYMGNTPPKHYLVCDGSVYNILDYPELANHILDEFGVYNRFGGDGIDTFAVPNLKGRFLMGALDDSIYTLSALYDGTRVPFITTGSNGNIRVYTEQSGTAISSLTNSSNIRKVSPNIFREISGTEKQITTQAIKDQYDARPLALPPFMSITYCIKYEKTYFMNITKTVEYEQLELLRQQNELLREEIRQLSSIVDQINRTVV